MKIKKVIITITVIVMVIMFTRFCFIPFWSEAARQKILRDKQQELAQELGVSINDYRGPDVFPVGYFSETLQPGMTYREVHLLIQEYEMVLACFGREEVYYYFNTDDITAIRFIVLYDTQGNFLKLSGEEPGSGYLIDGMGEIANGECVYGLLGE